MGFNKFKKKKEGTRRNPFKQRSLKDQLEWSQQKVEEENTLDRDFGYVLHKEGKRLGFLLNLAPTSIRDPESGAVKSAVSLYFVANNGQCFKCSIGYEPYFYLLVKESEFEQVRDMLMQTFSKEISKIEDVSKTDLDQPNHLAGLKRRYMKLCFLTVPALLQVRRKLMGKVKKNKSRLGVEQTYSNMHESEAFDGSDATALRSFTDFMYDIREYDVPYYMRFAIDTGVRVGCWYDVDVAGGIYNLSKRADLLERAQSKIFAFDIETTHAPLRFPDAQTDSITMISYMLDTQGYLIVNRDIVSADIEDFEYTPKPEFPGPFHIFNEQNEVALLRRFFQHIRQVSPHVFVSFNGDGFDWPFIDARAKIHGMNMQKEIGVYADRNEEYKSHFASHLDCYRWVVRDSYLPVGSQGLKAVTKAKLGYDPLELDPEDMVKFATERPQELASYSVSDAVATYYLYQNYVHPFIFSLCTIIPMHPDDVLRKGSGTLCEALLMVQATEKNIVYPNKEQRAFNKMHNGHLIESETYIGGHVESLAAGIFRADIPMDFDLDETAFQELLDDLERTLRFAVSVEAKASVEEVANFDEVLGDIRTQLEALRDAPKRSEKPLIYHLDVGAMYPNIILTNRLQPSAIVDDKTCAACDFNKPANKCQKKMQWTWRGDLFPADRSEYELVRSQLESEKFPSPYDKERTVTFFQLPMATQQLKLKQRLKDYCRRVYRKNHVTLEEQREDTVCMRENSFYVDTVRLFRDRRYEYKAKLKEWQGKVREAKKANDAMGLRTAEEMRVIYDSLQVAHKCILNSFYGYVMRRGARWFSMEMAGMVTFAGAEIIRRTRELVERIGIALELDTDGIWCTLPSSFPENFSFEFKDGSRRPFVFSYACIVLNHMVARDFTNHQYQELVSEETRQYRVKSENSIFFEVDGPYAAMILPSAIEEGKTLKKRYAVFRFNGTLAELKGFELKRRGELQLIKIFQSQVFETFLRGTTLAECYAEVAKVGNRWLDVLYNQGADMEEEELIELLSSSSSMSKALAEYGNGKSAAITTAKRLAELLGPEVVKEKGLNCKYVVSKWPANASVTERCIPTLIFSAERDEKNYWIGQWIKDTRRQHKDYGIRDILDWDYYIHRFGNTLQKIITIPAALQGVENPMPRVKDPEWLVKRKRAANDPHKQVKLETLMKMKRRPKPGTQLLDIENAAGGPQIAHNPAAIVHKFKRSRDAEHHRTLAYDDDDNHHDDDDDDGADAFERHAMDVESEEERELAVVEVPDKRMDYTAWLQHMKGTWKKQRVERSRTRALFRSERDQVFTVTNYEERARFRYAREPWRILKLEEAAPGEFGAWVYLGAGEGLTKLRVLAQRKLYINTTTPYEDEDETEASSSSKADAINNSNNNGASTSAWSRRRVQLILPRSKPIFNLYELSIPERLFRTNSKALTAAFTSHDVEGVYEVKTSLLYELLVHLGAVCSVDVTTLHKERSTPSHIFRLDQLQRKSTKECHYVAPDALKAAYLYHSHNASNTKGFFGLCLPGDATRCHVVLYDSQRVDAKPVNAFLKKRHSGVISAVTRVTRPDLAARVVQKLLSGYRVTPSGLDNDTMLLYQSTLSCETLAQRVPATKHFPVIPVLNNASDNAYHLRSQWTVYAASCFMQRRSHLQDWLKNQFELAAYAELPLGNFSVETPSLISDVFYTRVLKSNGFLSWASDGPRPDLGGSEEDNNNVLLELYKREVVNPGCYDGVCIEVNIYNLAINAILQSHLINDAEDGPSLTQALAQLPDDTLDGGVDGEGAEAGGGALPDAAANQVKSFHVFDDTADCVGAFQVLKRVVQQWTIDVGTRDDYNQWAELLIDHVYYWISSPQSKLYDPSLHKIVNMLMRKVWLQLMYQFKQLGSKVVYASFNKIVLATNKTSYDDAKAYWDYILKSVRSNELFAWMQIEDHCFWDVLLFMDATNYAGVAAKSTTKEGEAAAPADVAADAVVVSILDAENAMDIQEEQDEVQLYEGSNSDSEDVGSSSLPDAVVDNSWSLAEYLPAAMHQQFLITITKFVNEMWKALKYPDDKRSLPPDGLISTALTQRLLRTVTALHNDMELQNEVAQAPLVTVGGTRRERPAVQFVNTLCHVLSLDSKNAGEVLVLKQSLLRVVGVDSFSKHAQFHNPCSSFVLRAVICSFCALPRDLDLLRDPELLNHDWRCPECKHEQDAREVQSKLTEIVYARSFRYQAQDFKCCKCALLKADCMSDMCPTCSGVYVPTITRDDFLRDLDVFLRIAQFHKMEWLQETVERLMK